MRKLIAVLSWMMVAFVGNGQTFGLLKDVWPGNEPRQAGIFHAYDTVAYFARNRANGINDFYRTDGTAAGTRKILPDSVDQLGRTSSTIMVGFDQYVFIQYSTGTPAGKFGVVNQAGTFFKDIPTDSFVSVRPGSIRGTAKSIFFIGRTSLGGREYHYEINAKDLVVRRHPIHHLHFNSSASFGDTAGGRYYGNYIDANGTSKVFSSNGDSSSFVQDESFPQLIGPANLTSLNSINGQLLLHSRYASFGDDGIYAKQQSGSFLRIFQPKLSSRKLYKDALLGNNLYYFAHDPNPSADSDSFDLYKTNGLANGTIRIGKLPYHPYVLSGAVEGGDYLYYAGSADNTGLELYRIHTSTGLISLVKDFTPGPKSGIIGYDLERIDSFVYCWAADSAFGQHMFQTHVRTGVTTKLESNYPGASATAAFYLPVKVNGRIIHQTNEASLGRVVFSKNASSATVTLVNWTSPTSFYSGTGDIGGVITHFRNRLKKLPNNKLLFIGISQNQGREYWESDLTSQGTITKDDYRPYGLGSTSIEQSSSDYAIDDSFMYVGLTAVWENTATLLRRSHSTGMVQALKHRFTAAALDEYQWSYTGVSIGEKHFVHASRSNKQSGFVGYVSRFTDSVTVLPTGSVMPNSANLFSAKMLGKFMYAGSDSSLLMYDTATRQTTQLRTNVNELIKVSGYYLSPNQAAELNSKLYFPARVSGSNNELYSTDGTNANTAMVADIFPGSSGSQPNNVSVWNNKLYFSARNSSTVGSELWTSDGSNAGTKLVKDLHPTSSTSPYQFVTTGNGKLYFIGWPSGSYRGIYTTDGTDTGTILLKSFRMGSEGHYRLYPSSNYLYFTATDSATGNELWRTDGTPQGTVLVADINPGPASSDPELVLFGDTLVVAATTAQYGRELFISTATVLPARKLELSATWQPGQPQDALLRWKVQGEGDTKTYQAERSEDGQFFRPAAPAVEDRGKAEYQTTDAGAALLEARTLYYRIRASDGQGRSSYSQVAKLSNPGLLQAKLLPNPAEAQTLLQLQAKRGGQATVQIFGAGGSLIRQQALALQPGQNQLMLPLNGLSKGQYRVVVKLAGEEALTLGLVKR